MHIIKLIVGADNLEHFAQWQQTSYTEFEGQTAAWVKTRYQPKRSDEILKTGGSIYRVINGNICCRQEILGFGSFEDPTEGTKCLIYTKPEIIRTQVTPKKAFQGWRYLAERDAPKDIGLYDVSSAQNDSPTERELKTLGLL